MDEIYRNAEHYADPTAGEAIRHVALEEGGEPSKKTVYREQPEREEPARKARAASPFEENWEDLANAVILQVVEAYREARKKQKTSPNLKNPQEVIRKAERFFRSRWFAQLTDVDGEWLLERLRQE